MARDERSEIGLASGLLGIALVVAASGVVAAVGWLLSVVLALLYPGAP